MFRVGSANNDLGQQQNQDDLYVIVGFRGVGMHTRGTLVDMFAMIVPHAFHAS